MQMLTTEKNIAPRAMGPAYSEYTLWWTGGK